MSMRIKRLARKHIGRDISAHSLRHSWATWALQVKKMTIKKVQTQLGHSSSKTTIDLYDHGEISWEDVKDLYD